MRCTKKWILGCHFFSYLFLSYSDITYAAADDDFTKEVSRPSEFELERMQPRTEFEMLTANLAGDNISLADGGLSFSVSDISIPLASGPFRLDRSYNRVAGFNSFKPENFGDWELTLPNIQFTALKGDTRFSSNFYATTSCSNLLEPGPIMAALGQNVEQYEYWTGSSLTIPGSASGKILTTNELNSYQTKDNALIRCQKDGSGNEFFSVNTPDGKSYKLGQRKVTSQKPLIKNNKQAIRLVINYLVTEMSDKFGNKTTYNYTSNGQLTSVWYSENGKDAEKLVELFYSGNFITKIESQGLTWQYLYSGNNLSKVILPSGKEWQYSFIYSSSFSPEVKYAPYNSEAGYNVSAKECAYISSPNLTPLNFVVKHPDGAIISFDLAVSVHGRTEMPTEEMNKNLKGLPEHNINGCFGSLAVAKKTISYATDKSYTWTYQFANEGSHWRGPDHYLFNSDSFTAYNDEKSSKCAANAFCRSLTPKNSFHPYDLRVLDVIAPDNSKTRHFISKRWDYTENQVVGMQVMNASGTILTEQWSEYSPSNRLGMAMVNNPATVANESSMNYRAELTQRKTVNNSSSYFYNVLARDNYGYETSIKKTSADNRTWYLKNTYSHDLINYELGKPLSSSVSTDGINYTEAVKNTFYDVNSAAKGSLFQKYRFNQLVSSSDYHASGHLKKMTFNGVANRWVSYADFYRGLPRLITKPQASGNLTIDAKLQVDNLGRVVSLTNFNGARTDYRYDASGRLTLIDPADNRWESTTISYAEANGLLTQSITSGNLRQITFYDGLLRPLQMAKWDATDEFATKQYINKQYDYENHETFASVQSAVPGETRGTRTDYDALGRIIKVTRPDGYAIKTEYLSGHESRVTDAKGYQTRTTYLAYGEPSFDQPLTISSPEGVITSLQYNVFGNITRVQQGNQVETRLYDAYQRLCILNRADVGTSAFAYNNLGEKIYQVDGLAAQTGCINVAAQPNKTSYSYNNHGLMSRVDYADSSDDVSYSYDNMDQLTALSSGITSWAYQYNSKGLPELERLSVDGKTYTLGYEYNGLGLLTAQTYPSGRRVDYNPNALGQATKAGSYVNQTSYFPSGQLQSLRYGNGLTQRYSLNSNNMVEDLTLTSASGNGYLLNLRHRYDANLNVERIDDFVAPNESISLSYDGLDRLISATGVWGTGQFSYDVLGNITRKVLGNQSLSYNYDSIKNRLLSVTGSVPASFNYDDRGNVTHNGRYSLSFNRANQLTAANGNSYVYDGHNRRVKKSNPSGTEYSFYSQDGRLYSTQKGSVTTDYIYLGSQLVAKDDRQPSAGGSTVTIPSVPTGFSLTLNSLALTASWPAVTTATSYKIQWAVNGIWQPEVNLANVTNAALTGSSGNNYQFRLRACNSAGCSAQSSASAMQTVAALSKPTLIVSSSTCNTDGACSDVTLLASNNSDASRYVFEYKKETASTWNSVSQTNAFWIFGSTEQSTFQFRAKMCDNAGNCSTTSDIVTFTFNQAIPVPCRGMFCNEEF